MGEVLKLVVNALDLQHFQIDTCKIHPKNYKTNHNTIPAKNFKTMFCEKSDKEFDGKQCNNKSHNIAHS